MSTPKFPIKIKRGSAAVKIYRGENGGYEFFTLAYHDGNKRQRRHYADLAEARREAESTAMKLCQGELDVLTLSSADRAAYVRACQALKPTGATLDTVAREYAEAHKRLGGRPIIEAIDYYVRHCPKNLPRKTVQEVYQEMLAAKKLDGRSPVYLKDLKFRIGKFADTFHSQIADVSIGQVNDFLRTLKCSGRGKNNSRVAIITLLKFAEASSYLPKGHFDFEKVTEATEADGAIEIFTPSEIVALLNAARHFMDDRTPGVNLRYTDDSSLLAYLALGAFSGLRTAEIQRQAWADVHLDRGFIRVTAAKGGTAQKRQIPIQPNLAKWLALCDRSQGVCCGYKNLAAAVPRIATRAGVKWKHNALRHSYISYRVAQTQSIPQTALEAGNSVQMVNRHYREVVTVEEATAWFSIEPEKSEKIVQLPTGKVAEFVRNLSGKQG